MLYNSNNWVYFEQISALHELLQRVLNTTDGGGYRIGANNLLFASSRILYAGDYVYISLRETEPELKVSVYEEDGTHLFDGITQKISERYNHFIWGMVGAGVDIEDINFRFGNISQNIEEDLYITNCVGIRDYLHENISTSNAYIYDLKRLYVYSPTYLGWFVASGSFQGYIKYNKESTKQGRLWYASGEDRWYLSDEVWNPVTESGPTGTHYYLQGVGPSGCDPFCILDQNFVPVHGSYYDTAINTYIDKFDTTSGFGTQSINLTIAGYNLFTPFDNVSGLRYSIEDIPQLYSECYDAYTQYGDYIYYLEERSASGNAVGSRVENNYWSETVPTALHTSPVNIPTGGYREWISGDLVDTGVFGWGATVYSSPNFSRFYTWHGTDLYGPYINGHHTYFNTYCGIDGIWHSFPFLVGGEGNVPAASEFAEEIPIYPSSKSFGL